MFSMFPVFSRFKGETEAFVVSNFLAHVDRTLNRIWHVVSKRAVVNSLAVYCLVLMLGPIMIGLSIGFTLYISMLTVSADPGLHLTVFKTAAAMVISSATFAILYKIVPNVPISFRSALVGGASAGFLFEIFKKIFGFYLSYFPTNQLIYGALATIQILFIWIYVSWIIVLLGAEITITTECMKNDG